jgi:hypothetical protein
LFTERLQNYPNWPALDKVSACVKAELPALARPAAEPKAKG